MAPGRIGIVSRSSTLVDEVGRQLPMFSLGASTIVYVPEHRPGHLSHLELLKTFSRDWGTDAVLLLGAIDADEEEACAGWIEHMDKPVIGFIEETDAARSQKERLRACGVHFSQDVASLGALTASLVELPWLPFD